MPNGPKAEARWRGVGMAALIAAVPIVFLAGACTHREGGGQARSDSTRVRADADSGDTEEAASKEKTVTVDAAPVWRGDLVLPIQADGTIRTPNLVEIRSKVGGELVAVHVQNGDHVKRGQLIAQIDPREYQLAVEESRHRYLGALAQAAADADTTESDAHAVAKLQRQRQELGELQRRGSVTRGEADERLTVIEMEALRAGAYRAELFAQRTGLADARLAEERARLNLEHTRITAPFDGVVENLEAIPGAIVGAGALVCRVVNNDALEASVRVLEADLRDLVEGRPAIVAVPATGDTVLAKVDVIAPTLDAATRTCQVLIRFANPGGRLRAGMFVRTQIAGFIYPQRLLVPAEAVLTRDDRTLVFKVNGDRAQWLYVDTGPGNDQWVEITAVAAGGSLTPGDRVVVSDHLTLAHEAKIKVRATRPVHDRWSAAPQGVHR